jgi:hypothetical protein
MRLIGPKPLANPKRLAVLIPEEECKVLLAIRALRASLRVQREVPRVIRGVSAKADRGEFSPGADPRRAVYCHRLGLGLRQPPAANRLRYNGLGLARPSLSPGETPATLSSALRRARHSKLEV